MKEHGTLLIGVKKLKNHLKNNMKNDVTIIKNILNDSQLNYCKNKIIELDNYFEKNEKHQWYHNKLGSYTEFNKKIGVNYKEKVNDYNPILWDNFKEIYLTISNKISDHLNIECCYDKNLFLPGFRTFIPKETGIMNSKLDMFHYDYNLYFVNWNEIINKEIKETTSITVCIESPEYSYFDYIQGTQTNEKNLYHRDFSEKEIYPLLENKVKILCKEGSATCIWNHVLHRMGELKFSNLQQKRTTMQISGLYDGEKVWLTW